MYAFRQIFCAVVCLITSSIAQAQLPQNYQLLSSSEKLIILWQNIENSHQENPLPDLTQGNFWHVLKILKGLFSLKPSFDHVSDEMPDGRVKIIHANGSVAKVSLIASAGHPFTGFYQTGGIGLARLSLGGAPSDDTYTPGMALKLLMPGKPSANLQVMYSLEGQGENWNFFAHEFSNKIDHPSGWTLKAIEKIFEWTKKPANELTPAIFAKWDNQGHEVNNVISPEQLHFKPSEAVAYLIDPASRQDFRQSLLDIPQGALYEVYGDYQGISYHIGTLMLESPLLASQYGDENLFFQHPR